MRTVLSRIGAFCLFNHVPTAALARQNCHLLNSQLAAVTTIFTRPRYYTSGPQGHIRDATDSAFSKKEKADAEKIKHLREEIAKQKEKLAEIEGNLDELHSNNKKD
ncbi:2883_t:CDS:2 [Funneliformis caledonium]|uniref:2883_t:CDS:1 n=2 Tax=Funneliformis TaxID=1117308 RepID=A0A9N9HMX1_9GLOM|nr:12713_t:CDS:2 [Funneliformis mosseae]CAG8697241.1 2883_t:CDS:2 [Funneliformis caledonium]